MQALLSTMHMTMHTIMHTTMSPIRHHGGRALAMALGLLFSVTASAGEGARAEAAWVPEPPSVARHAAAYVTLQGGTQADSLVGVSSPVAEVAEVHESSLAGGVLRMRPVTTLPLAAGQRIEFTPGGYHIMLINVRQPLKAGDRVPLELRFEKAGRVHLEAEVQSLPPTPPSAIGSDHHHHH